MESRSLPVDSQPLPVASHPRLAGVAAALGVALSVFALWFVLPDVAFVLSFLGQFVAASGLFMFVRDRGEDADPYRDFGELPEYSDDGFADAWLETVAPAAGPDGREAVIRATRAFLTALFAVSVSLTFLGGRAVVAVRAFVGLA
ncbi:MAG: hypothetical protein V5A28_14345 [Haloarculaceae archaeon]